MSLRERFTTPDPVTEYEFGEVDVLGPDCTYSELAARAIFNHPSAASRRLWRGQKQYESPEFIPFDTFASVADAVRANDDAVGVLPVDNQNAAIPEDVMFELLKGKLLVLGEANFRVELMIASTGSDIKDVKTIHSIPTAREQADETLSHRGYKFKDATSTADAAKTVAKLDPTDAAICSRTAAKEYGLQVLEVNVEDDPDNSTLFWIVHRRKPGLEPDVNKLLAWPFGRLRRYDTVRAAAIVSPVRKEVLNPFLQIENYFDKRKLEVHQMGSRTKRRTQPRQSLIEITGKPGNVWHALRDARKYEGIMTLDLLGIFCLGRTYYEEQPAEAVPAEQN